MHTTSRYILIILGIVVSLFTLFINLPRHISFSLQISLHYLLTFVHKDYGRATSLSSLTKNFTHSFSSSISDDDYPPLSSVHPGVDPTNGPRANATFIILARNSELESAITTIRSIEDRFNRNYRYPYVFLNDEPFTDDFKRFIQFPSDLLSSI